jgi:hypothetical protein
MTYRINTQMIKLFRSSNLKWVPSMLKILLGDFIDSLFKIADLEIYKQLLHHFNGIEAEGPSDIFRYLITIYPNSDSLILSNSSSRHLAQSSFSNIM